MALVRINRNGTYFEMYHVANDRVEIECSRLIQRGLLHQSGGDIPATNSFTVMQQVTMQVTQLEPQLEKQLVHVA